MNAGDIVNCLLPISHGGQWFLTCYFGLYLLAPLINKAIEHLDRRSFIIVLVLLTIFNEYFGYFWKLDGFNRDGYTISQMVYLYVIARYIGKNVRIETIRSRRWRWLLFYFIGTAVYAVLSYYWYSIHIPHWDMWKYNNPLLIINSVTVLLFFLSFDFKSKAVNALAASTFAMYLLQGGLGSWLYPLVGKTALDLTGGAMWSEFAVCGALALIFVIGAFLLDRLMQLVQKPFYMAFDSIYPKLKCSLSTRLKVLQTD